MTHDYEYIWTGRIAGELAAIKRLREEAVEKGDELHHHQEGIQLCETLIEETPKLKGTALLGAYRAAMERRLSDVDYGGYLEKTWNYQRSIGVDVFPGDIFAYVTDLLALAGEEHSLPKPRNIPSLRTRNLDLD